MKLEPIKKSKVPKYAAALAAAAVSASLLTGCGLIEEMFERINQNMTAGIVPTHTESFERTETSEADTAQTEPLTEEKTQ